MSQPHLLTNEQARRFLLHKQGLLGARRFIGTQGVLDYMRDVGCIQFDPVDVCGRNAELVLQSRVTGFTRSMLSDLLYRERALVDYFDKNLCIMPIEDWPNFARTRARYRSHKRGQDEIDAVRGEVINALRERGPLCSAELDYGKKIDWFWSDTRLARAALEQMYFCGELAIHHKKGIVRYYDLAENCFPVNILQASDPLPDDEAHRLWHVERRIGSVGLLWNRASDAWLGIEGLKAAERNNAFEALLRAGRLIELRVEGIAEPLYCHAGDGERLDLVCSNAEFPARCEFIAPLDNLLWDRKLIGKLFDFHYKWEIYTAPEKRQYSHYVLPVLINDRFVARIELIRNKESGGFIMKNLWLEEDVRPTKHLLSAIDSCVRRLECFDKS